MSSDLRVTRKMQDLTFTKQFNLFGKTALITSRRQLHGCSGGCRPFQKRDAITRASAHANAEVFRSVINPTCKSNFWLNDFNTQFHMFDQDVHLFSCYCYTGGCHRCQGTLIFSFWKLLILHRNQKSFFLSPIYKHLTGMFTYKSLHRRKLGTRNHFFFKTNLFRESMKKSIALLAKQYG